MGLQEESNRGFRSLPHTADKAMEAWGASLPELFEQAAQGMFAETVECERVLLERTWELKLEAENLEELMHAWLAELLWIWEREEAVPCQFEVRAVETEPWRVLAVAKGGTLPEGAYTGAAIKAVTYHELRIWQDNEMWWAHVVFDV